MSRTAISAPGAVPLGSAYAFAFIESVGTILLQRGLYFYTHDLLGFSETDNLGLALLFGVTYVVGALLSHPLVSRIGEKGGLYVSLSGLLVLHTALWLHHSRGFIALSFGVVAVLQGIKWPIIESYVSAGQTPSKILTTLGRFNVSWASAVPVALALTGPLVGSRHPELLFALAAAINVVALVLVMPWPTRPIHLADDHPERPAPGLVARLGSLLVASRWLMLASYALLFLLAPLMPGIFSRLGLSVSSASTASSAMDVVRVGTFALLAAVPGWHGKTAPVAVSILALPLGFALVLFGPSLPLVLFGELTFGAAAGVVYYAALYYALVVKNASVGAGGAHESLIGLGFAIGPLLGLAGHRIADLVGNYVIGMLLGVMPLVIVSSVAAGRALIARGKSVDQ